MTIFFPRMAKLWITRGWRKAKILLVPQRRPTLLPSPLFLEVASPHASRIRANGCRTAEGGLAPSEKKREGITVGSSMQLNCCQIAFFVNVYNALVIHAMVVLGPPQNMWQRAKFFSTVSYRIGGHVFTLSDIENGYQSHSCFLPIPLLLLTYSTLASFLFICCFRVSIFWFCRE